MASSLFPTIGSLAEQADNLPEKDDGIVNAEDEDEERPLQQIESLCMACGEQGETRLMLTTIPYFREIIVMSFRCEHCGNVNNEVQSAGTVREKGIVYTAKVLAQKDLDRQIVKSQYSTITVPEYEITIPPSRGQLTTIEGLLRDIVTDLSGDQPLRRIQDEVAHDKIQALIDKLKVIVPDEDEEEGESEALKDEERQIPPFTIKLDDPSGNSWIEFEGSMADPKWNMREYARTREQNVALSLVSEEEAAATGAKAAEPIAENNEEIFKFPGICSSCSRPLDTLMKKVNIPYFKDIIIMSTNCEACGYKDNEVKSGAAISEQGKKITLKVEDYEDLSRDILKSESCGLSIPEIGLELQAGTLGGRFTTLEGILEQVYEELSQKVFASGDASDPQSRATFEQFLGKLKEVKTASTPFTLILDDPLANSYLQNLYAPDPDPAMEIVLYDRTEEQNDELGLLDMKVEGYEEEHAKTIASTA